MADTIPLVGVTLKKSPQDLAAWSTEEHEKDLRSFVSDYLVQRRRQKLAPKEYRPDDPRTDIESVCGRDTRTETRNVTISSELVTRAVCHLAVTMDNGDLVAGTGFFVAPRKVVTAAHCLYDKEGNVWASQVIVRPGLHRNRSGQIVAPFLGDYGADLRVPGPWQDAARPNYNYDWALISLATEDLFNRAGRPEFSLWAATENDMDGQLFSLGGYPDLAPFPNQRQYFSSFEEITRFDRYILSSMHDTSSGNSGGPLFLNWDTKVVGIVSHQYENCTYPNGFTRVTREVKETIDGYA